MHWLEEKNIRLRSEFARLKYQNRKENRPRSNGVGVYQQNYETNSSLAWTVRQGLVVERASHNRVLQTGQETRQWYTISVELFHLIWQSLPWPLSCLQTYSLYNSPIKPQILTTERFRSKPFTKQALDDKKCTVDKKLPKFSRSGIPSIRDYARQSSLYEGLKWEYPLIKAWRKKYCICIEVDVHSSRLMKTLTKQRAFCLDQACCTVSR